MYYIELYQPWFHRYPVRYPQYPYGHFYGSHSFSQLQQQQPFYFGSITSPSFIHVETTAQQNSINELKEAPKPQAEVNKIGIKEEIISNTHKLHEAIKDRDQQSTKDAISPIETAKDSPSTRDKSLLINIFDQSLGNRKAVNILSYFPNFKLTRPSGSKTIAMQGLSVG